MKKTLLPLLMALSMEASEFPLPYNSETDTSQPMSPTDAAANMRLPPGFKATVFASEPDVQNPIAMAWDGRGRLWVAENYTYAEPGKRFDLNLRDRILIFEDKDGDGHFDTRKVFTDEVQMLTSIEVGRGGVWAMCPPQLLFIPDRNGDDAPDGAPEVVLDGFTVPAENYHNFANGLRFGPDGWLYGRCGASSPGQIGAPGTPAAQRIPMRGTIWRYHPQRKIVEVLSGGCTNPWGHDWNEDGELFFINTVNGHLWHEFAGAHFVRPHTIDPNPRAYALIDQHADHWHFDTSEGWSKSSAEKAGALGGGHAHVGMMIYLGDNWPAEYRGHLFTLNLHGRRANQEILERNGSGYVGRHGPDFFLAADPWFRGMELSYGPDGGVFVLDWSDTGECHESTGVHRTSGRIYKITYGQPKQSHAGDLAKLSNSDLVKLHTHPNEWFSRQARLELAARAERGSDIESAKEPLRELFENQASRAVKLRAFWSLFTIGATDEVFLRAQLRHANEHVRAWAIRFLTDSWPLDTTMSQRPAAKPEMRTLESNVEQSLATSAATRAEVVHLARSDTSGLVRLTLASTLQRLPVAQRPELAGALLSRKEDASDHNLPLLIWYGLIPVADADPAALARLAGGCDLPLTRRFIARRLVEDIEKEPAPLNALLNLTASKPESFQAGILEGMAEGLTGWRKAGKPAAWQSLATNLANSPDAALRDRARDLSVLFGDGRALEAVKKVALDQSADLNARKAALQTFIDNRPPDLRQVCERLIGERFLNSVAVRGLASFDDPAAGVKLVKAYRQFHPSERGQLLSALVSRSTFAQALLDAVAEGKIPRSDLSPFQARQIRSLDDPGLSKKLAEVWGELRDSPTDKQELIARWKTQLTSGALAKADKSRGRHVFNTACGACHTLHGEGGKVGPDLTGGGRGSLDYLLENIVDPSAVVTADFRLSILDLKDGRVLNGLIAAKRERTLTLQTMTETLTVERSEVAGIRESTLSLMPEGLLEALPSDQARDLIAYLMHQTQVPLVAAAESKAESGAARTPLVRAVDLNVNESQEIQLADETRARVKLLSLDETRDALRGAVREARVTIELNGQSLVLTSATYHLPVKFGGAQIDCPITKGHVTNSSEGNAWGLVKDARFRLWPASSPWIEPGTFVYPLKQRWFPSHTQMANEPSFVDGGEAPSKKNIYYHYGLDSGGAEGMVDVVAAAAGRVISTGKEILPGYEDSPAKPRYDVVYLLDDRGWYYRYSHLQTIDPAMRLGAQISLGQKVGVLGKEGGSGGWSHLHFDITSRQPSGLWGIQEGYAFFWEAYQGQYTPKLMALARPHHLVFTGDKVVLDGSKSWSADGKVAGYDWTFTDGTTVSGPTVERTYSESGEYSEILKITGAGGEVDYDFAVVLVIDKSAPERLPPTIHPAFAPTMNLHPGDSVTFKVRSFRTTFGNEIWDFGDGSEKVTVKSDGNVDEHAKDGYAVTQHRFAKPGHYLVRVERTNERGQRAVAHLHVPIESDVNNPAR